MGYKAQTTNSTQLGGHIVPIRTTSINPTILPSVVVADELSAAATGSVALATASASDLAQPTAAAAATLRAAPGAISGKAVASFVMTVAAVAVVVLDAKDADETDDVDVDAAVEVEANADAAADDRAAEN